MNIRIQAINFDVAEQLEQFVTKKINKLAKFNDSIETADIYLKVVRPEANDNKEVEITLSAPNTKFFASKVCNTFEEATDLACEALEEQIKKAKDKK